LASPRSSSAVGGELEALPEIFSQAPDLCHKIGVGGWVREEHAASAKSPKEPTACHRRARRRRRNPFGLCGHGSHHSGHELHLCRRSPSSAGTLTSYYGVEQEVEPVNGRHKKQ
jgi:hypothetical protein